MSTISLDVFALRDSVIDEYRKFSTSFTKIHAEDIRAQVEKIYGDARYWPEPLIQINANYKRTTTVGALVQAGALEAACGEIFRADGAPLTLYKHTRSRPSPSPQTARATWSPRAQAPASDDRALRAPGRYATKKAARETVLRP